MFDNIGDKIKGLAWVMTIIGIIASIVGSIIFFIAELIFAGFAVLLGGILLSWIGSFFTYGLGELISNSSEIKKSNARIQMLLVKQSSSNVKNNKAFQTALNDMINDTVDDFVNTDDTDTTDDFDEDPSQNIPTKDFSSLIKSSFYFEDDPAQNIPKKDECPRCFAKISENDKECPNCGYDLTNRK